MKPRTHLMVQQAEVLQTLGRRVGQRGQGARRHQAQHEATRQPAELSAVGQQLNEQLLDPTPPDGDSGTKEGFNQTFTCNDGSATTSRNRGS